MDSHWNSKSERRVYLSREELEDIILRYNSLGHDDCFICRNLLRKITFALEAFGNE